VSLESERLAEVAGVLAQRLNGAIRDVIPPEAQVHLLNAQRELLAAVFLIYEHQVGARRGSGKSSVRRRPASRRPSRVTRIRVD
jgi:hypothetical protein